MNSWDRDQLSLNLNYLYYHNRLGFMLAVKQLNIPADEVNEHLVNAHRVRARINKEKLL